MSIIRVIVGSQWAILVGFVTPARAVANIYSGGDFVAAMQIFVGVMCRSQFFPYKYDPMYEKKIWHDFSA